jgi:transposase
MEGGQAMAGRSKITADADERTGLRLLARSSHRAEADRARAILLTLEGRDAARIAAALGVHVSTVREWRGLVAQGGVAALKRRKPPGRPNRIGTAATALVEAILREDERHDGGWTLPRLQVEIERRGGPAISGGWLSVPLRQKGSQGAGRGTRCEAARMPRRSPSVVAGWRRCGGKPPRG